MEKCRRKDIDLLKGIAVHRKWKILSYLGTHSFEIFLWQQSIFALYCYFIDYRLSIVAFAGCILLTILLSEWSYGFFEKKIYLRKKIIREALLLSTTVSIFCFAVYKNSGVVRDIPEPDVKTANVPPHFNTAYIDLIEPIEAQTGKVYAFTPDHKLFSHDCRHLTRAGAMYYARILPLDIIFGKGYTDAVNSAGD